MAKYESKVKYISASVDKVYGTLANLENFRPILDNAQNNPLLKEQLEKAGQDPSQLEKLKDVVLTQDSVSIPAPMIGTIALNIIERENPADNDGKGTIKFETASSPIEANVWIQLLPSTEAYTPDGSVGSKMRVTLKADLNPMVKMMLGSKLETGIDKFADIISQLPYNMI